MKVVSCLALLGVCATVQAADVRVVEEIIAKINGDIITRSEIERSRRQFEAEAKQRGMSAADIQKAAQQREKDLLRDRIDQLLLVQKANQLSINVDSEVTKYFADIQRQLKIADPEKFQAAVREQSGMSYEDFRLETKNSILTQRVIRQEVGGRINIPKSDLKKYYDENRKEFERDERVFLREILVSTEGKDEKGVADAEKKAKDLVARARKGEKFYELARDTSDASSAEQGGDIGGWPKGKLNTKIEELVFTAEKGHVTDPIKTSNGFLILRVEEHHKSGLADFEEVENEIMEKLYTPIFQPKVREFLTDLRRDAFLEIKEGYTDSAAAPGKDTNWSDPAELKPETVTREEVVNQTRRKRLLWLVPLPGTKTKPANEADSK